MRHIASSFIAIRQTRACRHQTQSFHLFTPLTVVVIRRRRMSKTLLPVVRHFMHQGGKHNFYGLQGEKARIKAEFMHDCTFDGYEAVSLMVATMTVTAAQGDEASG